MKRSDVPRHSGPHASHGLVSHAWNRSKDTLGKWQQVIQAANTKTVALDDATIPELLSSTTEPSKLENHMATIVCK